MAAPTLQIPRDFNAGQTAAFLDRAQPIRERRREIGLSLNDLAAETGLHKSYLSRLESASYEPNDVACFTAHQMGSCRMGSDPSSSVADGRGELHDVQGVWIGDASAFPTAPGVNPMVSIQALAHRTASLLLS